MGPEIGPLDLGPLNLYHSSHQNGHGLVVLVCWKPGFRWDEKFPFFLSVKVPPLSSHSWHCETGIDSTKRLGDSVDGRNPSPALYIIYTYMHIHMKLFSALWD